MYSNIGIMPGYKNILSKFSGARLLNGLKKRMTTGPGLEPGTFHELKTVTAIPLGHPGFRSIIATCED